MTVKKRKIFPPSHATSRAMEAISVMRDSHLDEAFVDHIEVDDDSTDAVVLTNDGPQPMSISWALGVYVS